ncbi:superinfection immunity protein [Bradyrhizobium japonicum]|uniref:superinfection immunity protein n=1 Tax=Bradyrhizobium japonicum TaxID=375 RepID=UPI0012FDEFC3|nr:superinfection immunity protein [Bradyrhizobium japonicum]
MPIFYIFFGILLFHLYFIPSVVARWTKHPMKSLIFAFNIFLGWTIIGWILAMIWALNGPSQEPQLYVMQDGTLKVVMPAPSPRFRMEDYSRRIPWWGRLAIVGTPLFLLWLFGR